MVMVCQPSVEAVNLWSPYARMPMPVSEGSNVPLMLYSPLSALVWDTLSIRVSLSQIHTKMRAGEMSEVDSSFFFAPRV